MNPIVHVSPMTDLSPFKRKKLCEHTPQCDKFLVVSTLNESMTLCEKDAKEYSNRIYESLSVFPDVKITNSTWTIEQTRDLIEYLRNNDIRYGTYAELASLYGKTRDQVKDYAFRLRRKGAF